MLGINEPPVTIKNIEKTIIEHAFKEGWIQPGTAGSPYRQTRGRDWFRARRSCRRAATESRRAFGDLVRKERSHRRACCVTAFRISSWRNTVLDRRLDQMLQEGVSLPNRRARGQECTGGGFAPRFRRPAAHRRRGKPPQPPRARARAQGHSLRHGVSAAAKPPHRRRRGGRRRFSPPANT